MKPQLVVIVLAADLMFCVVVGAVIWVMNRNPETMFAFLGG